MLMNDAERQDIRDMMLLYLQLDQGSRNVLQTGMGFLLARQNVDTSRQLESIEIENQMRGSLGTE